MLNVILCVLILTISSFHVQADETKSSTGTDLTDPFSWELDSPGSTDVALWTTDSLRAGLTLGSDASWLGIAVSGALSDIDISGAGKLTLGSSGIETQGSGRDLSISNNIELGAAQQWNIDTGRQFTMSGQLSGAHALTVNGSYEETTFDSYLTTSDQLLWSGKSLS